MVTFINNHTKLISLLMCILVHAIVLNIIYVSKLNHKDRSETEDHELTSRTRYVCSERQADTSKLNTSAIINHVKFFYPINTYQSCEHDQVETILFVLSAIGNFRRRERVRKLSRGQISRLKGSQLVMLFFVGLPASKYPDENRIYQRNLINESKTFGDIIQVSEKDVYENVVNKAIGLLDWISKFCPTADFVLKLDDDVYVEISRLLISMYKQKYAHEHFLIGDLQVDKESVPFDFLEEQETKEEYPNSTYPPFLASPAIGLPTSTASLLYQQALRTKLVRPHDVFLTGICAVKLGIPLLHDRGFAFVHRLMRESNNTFYNVQQK